MSAKLLDGVSLSKKIKEELSTEVKKIKEMGVNPGLAVVIVGDNPASRVYVNHKKKDCEVLGINSYEYALGKDTTQEELLELIDKLNSDKNIHGILVQLPLPKQIDESVIIKSIAPHKDVDAFHPENVGKIVTGDYQFLPCTPAGVMDLIENENIDLCGKNCVIIGRSNIVGKPQALLMLHKNATVTICHSKTKNLKEICKTADILVVAMGRPKFVDDSFVSEGAVVIDVGINRMDDGKLCGDVDFDSVKEKASYITPVPGGVGPMTRATLMKNTVEAVKASMK